MAPSSASLTRPMWVELGRSVTEIEMLLVRADQWVSGLCLLMALWFGTVRPSIAFPLAGLCCGVLACFTVAHALLRRRVAVPLLRVAVPVLEIGVGGIAFWMMARFEGPAYALGSWVPPQLLCLYIAASILRLNRWIPLVMGVGAALFFQAVYWLEIAPHVQGDGILLHRPDLQFVRAGSLVLTGVAASLAVVGLERMMANEARAARARDLFGKYRILREIAKGGMGVVYEALYCPEGGFERRVAVKVIHPHLAADPAFIKQFREEAEICAQLAHPNLVAALDFGRVEATYFFAMEYVDGPTLFEIGKRFRKERAFLDPALVSHIGAEVAEGMHFAHAVARGTDGRALRVLHRDLSPANILLNSAGQVKILDFGVARAIGEARQLHTHNLAGKPSYLSPEQLQDELADERSDLWSVAVVLWELLCNRRLFRRDSEGATLLAVCQDVHALPSSLRSDVREDWDAFFERALAKDPRKRFHSAARFRDELRALTESYGPLEPAELASLATEL